MRWVTPKDILGINSRIRDLILPLNLRRDFPLVDNKALTADIANKNSIPTPEIYFTIHYHGEVKSIVKKLLGLDNFIVKPARGSQGGGILAVLSIDKSSENPLFETSRGTMTEKEFSHYIFGILSGVHSLDGGADIAIIQKLIGCSKNIAEIAPIGLPDVRVIVLHGFPIMAMIRVPTQLSGGKGNLHLGAVGCGIDLKSGKITHSIQSDRKIDVHPDSGLNLVGFSIGKWQEILELAARASETVRIGYLGADIVVDEQDTPLLLEMNARPGLSIQLANNKGLKPAIKKVLKYAPANLNHKERVAWSRDNI